MKYVKSQAVLYILDELLQGNGINCDEIMMDFSISKRTFMRYIAEVRSYLCNFYRNKEIEYDFVVKEYRIR